MFCKICGKEISEDKVYCDECEVAQPEEVALEVVEAEEAVEVEVKEEKVVEEPKSTRKMAVASMILGFCALFVPFYNSITAILAIIFGAIGRKHDLGLVGLVVGIIYFVNTIFVSLILTAYLVYFAIMMIAFALQMA